MSLFIQTLVDICCLLKCILVYDILGLNLDIGLLCDLIQTILVSASLERGISMKMSISNLVGNGVIEEIVHLGQFFFNLFCSSGKEKLLKHDKISVSRIS